MGYERKNYWPFGETLAEIGYIIPVVGLKAENKQEDFKVVHA